MNFQAARLKYLKLGQEIDKYCSGDAWANMHRTHSKLGIFLDAELGEAWRHAPESGVEVDAQDQCICDFVKCERITVGNCPVHPHNRTT